MKKTMLSNGIMLIQDDRETESVTISITMRVGSINEEDHNRGISHFIEHMIFEGTSNRTALQIANEIESLGGTIGAYTSGERTVFYVKVLAKHAKTAIDVLYDVIRNPLFEEKMIEKERTVVLSEIKMKKDEPRFYQWSVFQGALFRAFPLKHPVIGYSDRVKALKQKDFFDYYGKHYIPSNMIISVVGRTGDIGKEVARRFSAIESKPTFKQRFPKEGIKKSKNIVKKKMPIKQTYLVLGYIAPTRKDPDSYVFDVIQAILGRGLSGRLFDELRTKRGLGYDVGCHYSDNKEYGFIAAYATTGKAKTRLAKSLILEQFQGVDRLTAKELDDAKRYIEGEFLLHNEDTMNRADNLGFFEHVGDAKMFSDYIKNIRKVTVSDIRRVKRRYLKSDNYTQIVLGQE